MTHTTLQQNSEGEDVYHSTESEIIKNTDSSSASQSKAIDSYSRCTVEFNKKCKLVIKDIDYQNDAYHNGLAIKDQVEVSHSDTIKLGRNRIELSCIPEVELENIHSKINLQSRSGNTEISKNASYAYKFNRAKGPIADTNNVKMNITLLAKQFNTICTLASRLFAAQNEEEIVTCTLNIVFELSKPLRCAVVFMNPNNNILDLVGCKHSDFNKKGDNVFPVSANIIRHVINSEESIVINSQHIFKENTTGTLSEPTRIMCVPLHKRGGSLGVIYTETAGEYDEGRDSNTLAVLASSGHQIGEAIEKIRLHAGLEKVFHGSMLALAASIEAKDKYTKGHSERVTCYALMIADEMKLPEEERTVVELAGLLHDVGKIGVPESVLCSTGELTTEEFDFIKQHPQVGADIILKMPELKGMASVKDVANATKYHHEKYNGGGYPTGISGEKIPLSARILAVADTFDAITSNRTYRNGQPVHKAMQILKEVAGTQIDPKVFIAFKRIYERGDLSHPEKVRTHIDFDSQILRESTVSSNLIRTK